MTTKYKIVVGFVVMVCLIGAVVLLGFIGLQNSSVGFDEYRRLARLNVGMSDIESAMHSSSNSLRAFISDRTPERAQDAKTNIIRSREGVLSIREFAGSDSTKQLFEELLVDFANFEKQIETVITGIEASYAQYNDVVLPSALKMIDSLNTMTDMAESVSNTTALVRVSRVWANLAAQLSGLSRFAVTLAKEDAELGVTYLAHTGEALQLLGRAVNTEGGRRVYADLQSSFGALRDAFTNMEQQGSAVRTSIADISAVIVATEQKISTYNLDVNERMIAFGTVSLENNAAAQRNMVIVGAVGLLAGILIAVVIVVGIMRVLSQMSGFAEAVAAGRFDHEIKVKEKGEIGAMIASMRAIPEVLGRIISQAEELARSIRRGKLRERFDVNEFSGSFSQLSVAVNTVSDAYTTIIDAMPTPMMSANKEGKAHFFNTAWQSIVGEDLVGRPCKDALNAEACSNQNCFGKRAMQNNAPVAGETEAMHNGERKVLYANAMPLHDESGAIVGYMEIVSDLTELKQKEETMVRVAHQASEISDRVAAAAEQLAAQVEEISRGAEVQRSRVESTASAMNEMTATVTEVAQSAGRASHQSEDTRVKAQEGAGIVNNVVAAINAVNTVGLSLQQNMQELGTQAEGIGGVMNVISDIADQTNLLALNAAIEAARAGEAGRGFAVVADEVRKLAEKTMEATHEVGGNIDAIQHSTKINIGNVEEAVRNVGQATELANASGQSLSEIVDLASANSEVVANIATAAEEQSATSEEINRSVDEIARITTETADGMVQSSEAVQELSRMAQELRRVMEALR